MPECLKCKLFDINYYANNCQFVCPQEAMNKIKRLYYTWDEFNRDCLDLTLQIAQRNVIFSDIYPILRGGVPIAVRLSHTLKLPISSSIISTTLIVDDVVDTGRVRERYQDNYFASIHYKPWASCPPDFYVHTTEDWIVYPWERQDES